MGLRLNTFRTGNAYQKLVYSKGGYTLHMLRCLMWNQKTGDQDFMALMHDFVTANTGKNASTEDFLAAVNRHMRKDMDLEGNGRADWFIREWVYGTDIPSYRMEYSLAPGRSGQSSVHRQHYPERRVGQLPHEGSYLHGFRWNRYARGIGAPDRKLYFARIQSTAPEETQTSPPERPPRHPILPKAQQPKKIRGHDRA